MAAWNQPRLGGSASRHRRHQVHGVHAGARAYELGVGVEEQVGGELAVGASTPDVRVFTSPPASGELG
jgi:hypothetical protein